MTRKEREALEDAYVTENVRRHAIATEATPVPFSPLTPSRETRRALIRHAAQVRIAEREKAHV